jgi:hypothetical protein
LKTKSGLESLLGTGEWDRTNTDDGSNHHIFVKELVVMRNSPSKPRQDGLKEVTFCGETVKVFPTGEKPDVLIDEHVEQRNKRIAEKRGVPVEWVHEAHTKALQQKKDFSEMMDEIIVLRERDLQHEKHKERLVQRAYENIHG